MKTKYVSFIPILKKSKPIKGKYHVLFGKRSNGKTYACKELGLNGIPELGLKGYLQDGSQCAYVRRWKEDFRGKRGATLFDDMVKNGSIAKWSKGKWDNVYYYSGRWYLARYDKELDQMIKDSEPFCFAFAISDMEHDKSTQYPGIKYIFFDEFLTRGLYLPDEFILFMNLVSTIVRDRDDVLIFLLGNTVNRDSPYFNEMGLTHVNDMQPGDIDVYDYGDSDLHVLVEYTQDNTEGKKGGSSVYFAFDNPKLQMVTKGSWELGCYPHKPFPFDTTDIRFQYYIIYGRETLQCEIVCVDNKLITYIHRKTGEIKHPDRDVVFQTDFIPQWNYRRKINRPYDELGNFIWSFFQKEQVYYQDNEIGEVVRNYIMWCMTDKMTAR